MSPFEDFVDHAEGVMRGLIRAYATDTEVFLTITGGILSAARTRALRGIGYGILALSAYRRADQYVNVLHSNAQQVTAALAAIGQVTHDDIQS